MTLSCVCTRTPLSPCCTQVSSEPFLDLSLPIPKTHKPPPPPKSSKGSSTTSQGGAGGKDKRKGSGGGGGPGEGGKSFQSSSKKEQKKGGGRGRMDSEVSKSSGGSTGLANEVSSSVDVANDGRGGGAGGVQPRPHPLGVEDCIKEKVGARGDVLQGQQKACSSVTSAADAKRALPLKVSEVTRSCCFV